MTAFLRKNPFALRCALSLLILTGVASCKLWTIRPLESKAKTNTATTPTFSADRYVDAIWESKLVPAVAEKAVDLAALLTALDANADEAKKQYGVRDGDGPVHFMVKGEGEVGHTDLDSPHRTVTIRLPKYRGKTEIKMQIGPVFRGTSLRDAVGFIKFNEFINQLQYAEVATKLNDRVFSTVIPVLKNLEPASLQGKSLIFYGVFTLQERDKIMLTPVKLAWGGKGE
ncbi:MAG: DUF2291 domain-containing protein [Blastocatellia bacterium]